MMKNDINFVHKEWMKVLHLSGFQWLFLKILEGSKWLVLKVWMQHLKLHKIQVFLLVYTSVGWFFGFRRNFKSKSRFFLNGNRLVPNLKNIFKIKTPQFES
jgi:hypothetical protein